MASNCLLVDVLRASIIWTQGKSKPNCCVEVIFNQQSFTTSIKRNSCSPVWNERFYFAVGPDYFRSSYGSDIKVQVYHVNVESDTRRLLGTEECTDRLYHKGRRSAAKWIPWTVSTAGAKGMVRMKVFAMDINPMDTFTGRYPFCASTDAADPLPSSSEIDQSPALQLQADVSVIPQEVNPSFKSGKVVKEMQYLFVRVVRAHDLPDVDANGSLDPFVEVIFGGLKGVTHHLPKNKNPEWNTTFAFSFVHANKDLDFTVIVKDKDLVRDEAVGELLFTLAGYSSGSTDIILEPTRRYRLRDRYGTILTNGKEEPHLTIAFWIGTQAHGAYRDALIISDNIVSSCIPTATTSAQVYGSPRLGLLRVTIIECHGISMEGLDDHAGEASSMVAEEEVFIEARVGAQMVRTRAVKKVMTGDASFFWNEDLMLVVDTSVDEVMFIHVKARAGDACEEKLTGMVVISLSMIRNRDHGGQLAPIIWCNVERPVRVEPTQGARDHPRLCLRLTAESGYHVPCGGYHSAYWSTDNTLPADPHLPGNLPIGSLELGILRARGLPPRQDGKSASTNPYCLARYCGKWVRTRTVVNSLDPVFNEQYTWKVYETGTILTVGLFDNCRVQLKGKASAEVANNVEDRKLGKVRIRISGLENGRIYAHSYPLFVLHPSGVWRAGELQLAVRLRFSSTSLADMVQAYSRPPLPKMHYTHPLSVAQLVHLQEYAIQILATRLKQVESPPRTEVVEYMCGAGEGPNLWSIRKSKANMFRVLEVMTGLLSFIRWFLLVCSWRNPAATLLVHAIFVLALWFHTLALPSLLMSLSLMTAWNYRKRPTCPSYIDLKLSQVDTVTPDDLDEEFDAHWNKDKTVQTPEVVAARYDRLRSIAGRIQGITGDLASHGERIQALVSWTDRRATAIFELLALMAAVTLYFVPLKILVAVAGFYIMRHPVLRWEGTSFAANFLRRLPSKDDGLL